MGEPSAAVDDPARLARSHLPAQLSRPATLAKCARPRCREDFGRGAQKSHRGAGAATGSPVFLPPLVPGTAASAVDLWRIATGRIQAEEVGLVLRPSVSA